MHIEIGKLYVNKTFKYLLPCLKSYGDSFSTKLNTIHKLAFGIHDCYLDATVYEEQALIYILCDKLYQKAKFINFINYVKHQPYYVLDYPYDDMENGRKHMLVIKFPEEYYKTYEAFNESRFSQMYTNEQLHKLFDPKVHPIREQALGVMKKDKHMISYFTQKVNDVCNTTLTMQDVIDNDMELDFPIEKKKEFFNYIESEV